MKLTRTRAAILAAAMATGVGGAMAAPAQAAPTAETTQTAPAAQDRADRRSYYGSIAFNPLTLAVGYSNDASSMYWAKRGGMNRCQRYSKAWQCRTVVSVRNGCASLAIKYDSKGRPVRYATAYGRYKDSTISLARKRAGKYGMSNVRTRAYLCTTRYY